MRSVLKSGFFWQFAGGFALGAVALVSLHPAEANYGIVSHIASAAPFAR